MKADVMRILDALRGSYWFIPMVMTLCSALLAWGLISLDQSGMGWVGEIGWVRAAHPDGARQILSVIGGSMVTVAGTVFSVTIAAVVYASGQYGPRLLSNFMGDRGNQVTLGTFISTFVYCLLVLRTVRSADEAGTGEFVPDFALLMAFVLGLLSIAVLIYFIHHVPSKLHINSVIADVGAKLADSLDARFPKSLGEAAGRVAPDEDARQPSKVLAADTFAKGQSASLQIVAETCGYIQLVDDDTMLQAAKRHNILLRLHVQPGDFVHPGQTLADAQPDGLCTEEVVSAIRETFSVGVRRTPLQDIRFLIDELVEIAARALSPGVNDPFTAITCIDWLGASIFDLSQRELPSPLRTDSEGALRVIAFPVTFETLLDRSFGALSQYCAGDMLVAHRYITVLADIVDGCDDHTRRAELEKMTQTFLAIAAARLPPENMTRLKARAEAVALRMSLGLRQPE